MSTIRMHVADVAKSRDWYRKFLAIEPLEDLENFVSFKIGSTFFDLTVADQKSPISPGGSVGYWFVDDIDELVERAVLFGARIYRGPLDVQEVQRTIVQILDPCGNVVGFEGPLRR